MSHIGERRFTDEYVIPYIREAHPDATIQTEYYISDPRGFADLWVSLGTHHLACEVGNNDSSIRDESAQAVQYAGDFPHALPAVFVPDDHGDTAAMEIWRSRGVLIREVPTGGE